MSRAEPMRISRRLELLKATGRKHWTPAQFRRYMTKTLHAGAPYWPFPGEETPGGKNRPTPRQRKPVHRG